MNQNPNILLILKLLKETTTLAAVSGFLKEKGLHYSASSWDQLYSERILPAINGYKIDIKDLVDLLRIGEEYGRQHVFLYQCLDAKIISKLFDEERVHSILEQMGLADIIDNPKILDQPESPAIVDVRWEKNENQILTGLIIKIVEARISEKFLKENTNEDGTISKIYKPIRERVVNVIKLRINGNLELRIASQESKSYKNNVSSVWSLINNIIPEQYFSKVFLNKAKKHLWEKRIELHDIIKFSDSTLRNDKGIALKAASGSQDSSIFDDEGTNKSLETFLKHDAYCDAHNVWFLSKEGESIPSNNVHVLLSGELNEFAITPHSSEENYEYVLNKLRQLNS